MYEEIVYLLSIFIFIQTIRRISDDNDDDDEKNVGFNMGMCNISVCTIQKEKAEERKIECGWKK